MWGSDWSGPAHGSEHTTCPPCRDLLHLLRTECEVPSCEVEDTALFRRSAITSKRKQRSQVFVS